MARIKGGLNAKKKHNRVLKLAKGCKRSSFQNSRVANSLLCIYQLLEESRRNVSSDSSGSHVSTLLQE